MMTPEQLAEIRRRDSFFIKDLPVPGSPDVWSPNIKDALHDRRVLLAEVDRLRALVSPQALTWADVDRSAGDE